MIVPVEVGAGAIALLVSNGLLKEHQTAMSNKLSWSDIAVCIAIQRP